MDIHQRYYEYLRKVPKYGLRLATFHIDFANNVMFQLKLRKEDVENLHLQIIKIIQMFSLLK